MREMNILMFWLVVITVVAPAQTLTTLASFDGSDGSQPVASLVQGLDGNLYGTTQTGGVGQGVAFRVTETGGLSSIFIFCAAHLCVDGSSPLSSLMLAPNGSLYGTDELGGTNGGTVFRMSTLGNQSVLHSFCSLPNCTDGSFPQAGLALGNSGNFFGTTKGGGKNGQGIAYRISSNGVFTSLYSFCAQTNCIDGSAPEGQLVLSNDGNFYGTTSSGGAHGITLAGGTIFKISPQGALTKLYDFCSRNRCADGAAPIAPLVQGTDNNFYGVTPAGGASLHCTTNCGVVFRITGMGKLTTLYDFCSQIACTDGFLPTTLIQATDGNFYGTTLEGGANAAGTLFKLAPSGVLTTLYSFCSQSSCADGVSPTGLVQHTDGKLYGVTEFGGDSDDGTVFSEDIGLPPFVRILPLAAHIGGRIEILGIGLSTTNAVLVNGTGAAFSIQGNTSLAVTVPTEASSGFVTVITSTGTLTSNQKLQIFP